MRAEYRREDLGKGVRGKHFAEYQKGSNLVLLTPKLSKVFPAEEAVNSALNTLAGIAPPATALGMQSGTRRTKSAPAPVFRGTVK